LSRQAVLRHVPMSTSSEALADAAAEGAAADHANASLDAKAVKDQLLIMRSVVHSIQTMNNHILQGNDNLRKVKSRVKSNLEEQSTLWAESKCFFRHKSLSTLQEVEVFREWAFAKVFALQEQEQQLENARRVHIQHEASAAQLQRQEASVAVDKSTTPSKERSCFVMVPGPLQLEYQNRKAKVSIKLILEKNQSQARIKRLDEESQAKIKRKVDEMNALAQFKLDRKELENQARIKRKVDEIKALAQVKSDLRAPQQERIQKDKDDNAKDKADKKRERQEREKEREKEDQRHREEKAQKKLKKQEQLKQEEQEREKKRRLRQDYREEEKRQKMEAQAQKMEAQAQKRFPWDMAEQLKTIQDQKHWRAMFALCTVLKHLLASNQSRSIRFLTRLHLLVGTWT